MKLTGPEFAALQDALTDSHRDSRDLQQTLKRGGKNLNTISGGGPLPIVIMDVIEYAEARDWVGELVEAARASNPENSELYALAVAMGVEAGGVAVSEDTKDRALGDVTSHLERMVDTDRGIRDMGSFAARMFELQNRVCAVELGKNAGTGFLIGPETVLTNYHVVQPAFDDGPFNPADIRMRFDYRRLRDGRTTNGGIEVEPAPDWLVAARPFSVVDTKPFDEDSSPTESELDYAVIRTKEKVGLRPPSGPGDTARGWEEPIGRDYDFPGDSWLTVVQHPCNNPLSIDETRDAVVRLNGNGTRVHYRNNTMPGSSGSPVLNRDMELVALHHAGQPGSPDFGLPCHQQTTPAEYNEGIPIAKIQSDLAAKELGWVFGGEAP